MSVLIVEDDPEVRSLLADALGVGRRVTAAPTAEAALALLAESTFAVALVDVNLPGMGGAELVEAMRRLRPGIVIIVMSGEAPAVDEGWRWLDVFAFLHKPFTLDEVERAVAAAMGSRAGD